MRSCDQFQKTDLTRRCSEPLAAERPTFRHAQHAADHTWTTDARSGSLSLTLGKKYICMKNALFWLLLSLPVIAIMIGILMIHVHPLIKVFFTIVIGGAFICGLLFLDFWNSFGEAFTYGIDKERKPIWILATIILTGFFVIADLIPKKVFSSSRKTLSPEEY